MNWLSTIKAGEKKITAFLSNLIAIMFFAILALVILLVILRYVFNTGLLGGNESMEYLFIYTTAIGAAVSVGKNDHISISIFVEMLKDPFRKIIKIINYILVALINVIMIVYSIPWIRNVGNFESPVLRIPNKYIQIIIPIGCALAVIYALYLALLEITGSKEEEGK